MGGMDDSDRPIGWHVDRQIEPTEAKVIRNSTPAVAEADRTSRAKIRPARPNDPTNSIWGGRVRRS
jgi:hypothetical protein